MSEREMKGKHKIDISKYAIIIEMVIIFVVFAMFSGGMFFTNTNINNLLLQTCTYAIMGCSMVFVMVIGGIDLSAGAVVGFLCTLAATFSVTLGLPTGVTILLMLLCGVLIGAWNGYWVAVHGMPAFIVTLSGQMIFQGLTLLVGKGVSIGPIPESLAVFGRSFLPKLFFKDLQYSDMSIIAVLLFMLIAIALLLRSRRSKVKYGLKTLPLSLEILRIVALCCITLLVGLILISYRGVPNAVVILIILCAVVTFIADSTPFGRSVYAIGGNRDAARLSGINIRKETFKVYLLHGLVLAIASIIYLGRSGSASSATGTDFEFSAITGCILGGTSTLGGSGTAIGAVIGCLIMASLDNGMSLLNLGTTYQFLIKGMVLLIAVWLDITSKQKKAG